ncbi:hypothetical protein C5167_021251 [Papaver somniferum]|uniref:RanBD1 domain-containing protein n=1 Tax=Papaver somniferum TaxID=3469 RepID=A0A4Y7IYQ3_PAPSO|nr:ran-binding protein 1 homolog c-like [Papaver somniferum]RZC52831.1 hypothetical protein C5167_021251 [Papaver somniferum]
MASKDVEHSKVEEEEETVEGTNAGGEEEDTGAQIAPIIKLEEVAVTTGEEEEDVLLDLKAKLYRFDKDGNQWKERGVGTVKLLKHKQTSKVRLVMRQSKTLKICANHLVLPTISMQEHAGNEKSCVWHAADFSDGELKEELFCIRFASIENAKAFKEMVEEVAESQVKKSEESKEGAASLADDLTEKLSVGEKKEDVPTPEKKKDEPEAEASSAEKEKKDE